MNKGFTLIETLVAILILTMTVGAMLSLAANGYFSVRYAKNDIVATNLAQESLEYIRNKRDGSLSQGNQWTAWLTTLNTDTAGNQFAYGSSTHGCFSANGCIIDPYTTGSQIKECNGTCPAVTYYPTLGFYGYSGASYPFSNGATTQPTTFVRTITAHQSAQSSDQILLTATVRWLNGSTPKSFSQTMLITNWRP